MSRRRCCCGPAGIPCGTCSIPASNLTLTITNSLLGTFSIPLTFNGTDEWTSACSNNIRYTLECTGGLMQFRARYYIGSGCTGSTAVCSLGSGSPSALTLFAQTCSPLMLDFRTTLCSMLNSQGYTRLVVTV